MQEISVNLPGKSYPIYIGKDLLDNQTILSKHLNGQQVLLVTNKTLAPLYLPKLRPHFSHCQYNELVLPDGEQYKDVQHWQQILDALAAHKHHRDTTLIALGGGVIGDMVGFAAASYQRGVAFIQIPTSLLAQVDASIGGKTAVNHPAGKNFIGAFHQPNAVIIDTQTLNTLPLREFHAGMAEVIKVAMINDIAFFNWLEKNVDALQAKEVNSLTEAIKRACVIKRDIVVADEKEHGARALLNLGHTFAHAIEHELGYGVWLHGEAVAVGLLLACQFSSQQKLFDAQLIERVRRLLIAYKLPIALPKSLKYAKLLTAMLMDKKVQAKRLRMVLLHGIGEAFIAEQIDIKELESFLTEMDL